MHNTVPGRSFKEACASLREISPTPWAIKILAGMLEPSIQVSKVLHLMVSVRYFSVRGRGRAHRVQTMGS